MNKSQFDETMRDNRAESITRREQAAGAGGGSDRTREFDGWKRHTRACLVDLNRIIPDPDQPRTEFDPDALQKLAASILARGQLQPIRLRWNAAADRYIVVVGERRFRALQIAGKTQAEAIVIEGNPSPEDLLEDQLVENAVREDLKPVEQAKAFRALMTARGLSHRELADRLQISHSSVTMALGLLGLAEPIRAMVDSGELPAQTAYHVASKIEDPAEQAAVAGQIVANSMTRAEAVETIRQATGAKPRATKGRGAVKGKPKAPKLPTLRIIKAGPIKITFESKKGFDILGLLEAIRHAGAVVEAEVGPVIADDQAAA